MVSSEQAIQRAVAKRVRKGRLRLALDRAFHNRSTTDAKPNPDVVVDSNASDAPGAGETQAPVSHVQAQSD
jgi:hypothetical protein